MGHSIKGKTIFQGKVDNQNKVKQDSIYLKEMMVLNSIIETGKSKRMRIELDLLTIF